MVSERRKCHDPSGENLVNILVMKISTDSQKVTEHPLRNEE